MYWIKLSIILSSYLVLTFANNLAPILIWGGEGKTSEYFSLLEKTTEEELNNVVRTKMGKSSPPMVVFYREDFCIEHCKRNQKNLMKLKEYKSLVFIPEFNSSLAFFQNLDGYNQSTGDVDSLSDEQMALIKISDFDSFTDKFDVIKNLSPKSIGVLTGENCEYSKTHQRMKRDAEVKVQNTTDYLLIANFSEILFYAEQPIFIQMVKENKKILLGQPEKVTIEGDGILTSLFMSMLFKNESETFNITLEVKPTAYGYFILPGATVSHNNEDNSTDLYSKLDINWPRNFSYHCSDEVIFADREHTMMLTFTNMQVQMFTRKFSDAYDCTGFTSIPIWTSLFVTGILAMIMIWGISMLMGIRTMDRFDDPKGKTITISAQE